jgi:hypothetical protein
MIRLDADGLCEEALRRRPGSSFRDPIVVEGLRVLCDALAHDVQLHQAGRRLLQAELLRVLDQRLAAEQAAVFDLEIPPPPWPRLVIITGMPRTASTFFHSCVAEEPGVVTPRLSQMLYPMSVDVRTGGVPTSTLERVALELSLAEKLSPMLRNTHPMSPSSPEECIHALQITMASEKFSFMLPVPYYDEWLDSQDPKPRYRQLRQLYSHLFTPWALTCDTIVVKAPTHAWWLDAVRSELGPRRLIAMRRHPDEVRSSFERLLVALRTVFCDTEGLPTQAAKDTKRWVRRWETAVEEMGEAVWVDQRSASAWTPAALRGIVDGDAPPSGGHCGAP